MKINEVDKVTTLTPVECITAIAKDGSLVQISVSELAKALETLMPSFSRAFSYKEVAFKNGDTKNIGQIGGLMVIAFPWSDSNFSVYIVSSKGRSITLLHGKGYGFLDFSFSDSGDLLVYSRYEIHEQMTTLHVSYQKIMVG